MRRYKPLFTGRRDNFSIFEEAVIDTRNYNNLLRAIFKKCESKIKNRNLSCKEIIAVLNENFSFLRIIFELEKIDKNNPEYKLGLNSGGTDDDEFNSIYLFMNELCREYFNKFLDDYITFLIRIIDHELIHRNQAIRMKSKEIISLVFRDVENLQKYVSDKLEAMAFAFMIVEESRYAGWTDKEIAEGLKTLKSPSPIFIEYTHHFENDTELKKILLKYIFMYLDLGVNQ
jgi:hypothetical protein